MTDHQASLALIAAIAELEGNWLARVEKVRQAVPMSKTRFDDLMLTLMNNKIIEMKVVNDVRAHGVPREELIRFDRYYFGFARISP